MEVAHYPTGYPLYPPSAPAVVGPSQSVSVEEPPSFARKFVELMLYFTLLNTAFGTVTGTAKLRFTGGALLLAAGGLTFLIMTMKRERLPASFWFALAITAGANLSQVNRGETPVIGAGLTGFTHWISQLLMMCYIVRNDSASKRVVLFSTFLVIAMILVGGTGQSGDDRLVLTGVGSSFSNANRLATTTGMFAVVLLFYSLRSPKTLRPVLWGLALLMVYCLFLTVSRSGLLLLGCGLAVLVATILSGRGMRLGGIVLITMSLVVASQLAFLFKESISSFEERFDQESARMGVYTAGTITELKETMILGNGSDYILRSAGITAHNAFIYVHTCFGGVTAYPYLLWVLFLSVRVARMMFARDHSAYNKMLVLAVFGMGLGAQVFANMGFMNYSTIYATAMVEKYGYRPRRRHAAHPGGV